MNIYFSAMALGAFFGLGATSAGVKIIMVVWGVLAAVVGLKGIQYVAKVATYLPLIPLAILIILLIFLIVRNLVKLLFERRHGVVGSKLRTRLVAAFVVLMRGRPPRPRDPGAL